MVVVVVVVVVMVVVVVVVGVSPRPPPSLPEGRGCSWRRSAQLKVRLRAITGRHAPITHRTTAAEEQPACVCACLIQSRLSPGSDHLL